MAYIHTAGGFVLRVSAGREAVAMAIQKGLEDDRLLEFETENQGPGTSIKVTVNAQQVALVTEGPFPRP